MADRIQNREDLIEAIMNHADRRNGVNGPRAVGANEFNIATEILVRTKVRQDILVDEKGRRFNYGGIVCGVGFENIGGGVYRVYYGAHQKQPITV